METKFNPTTEQLIMLCKGETIEIDGKQVLLTVVEKQPDTPPTSSLKYEDIIAKERPDYWVDLSGRVFIEAFELDDSKTSVYTERDAKKLRATAQLLVVMHHANGGDWMPEEGGKCFYVLYERGGSYFFVEWHNYNLPQIYFRTREAAEKALADNKQLFNEYFGIDN